MHSISTKKAPAAIGPYSQGVVSGGLLFASGQIALDPTTGELVGSTIEEQTVQVMKNVSGLLEAAGTDFDHVIKTTCYLDDIADFAAFNEIYLLVVICLLVRQQELPLCLKVPLLKLK